MARLLYYLITDIKGKYSEEIRRNAESELSALIGKQYPTWINFRHCLNMDAHWRLENQDEFEAKTLVQFGEHLNSSKPQISRAKTLFIEQCKAQLEKLFDGIY